MGQALIAGRGALPAAVAAQMDAPLICSLIGNLPEGLTPEIVFRIEHLGTFVQTLTARGVTQVCLCGAVSRPQVEFSAIDAATLPLVPVLQQALQPGDDAALRAIIAVFEEAGMTVCGAHEIAPALLPPRGALSRAMPDTATAGDVSAARDVLAQMARIDQGQACVIRYGAILAREDARGTDAMLADLARPAMRPGPLAEDPFNWVMDSLGEVLDDAADWLSGDAAERARLQGAGALLVKAPKPGQDLRADLPTIGPGTARAAAAAGLRGIVIQVGGVMVLEREQVADLCDRAGLFLSVQDLD